VARMYYFVKSEDNLYKISTLFNVPIRVLAEENQLYHNCDVYPGKKISIPIVSVKSPYPSLNRGDVGHYVKLVQQILIILELYEGIADGIYNEQTEKALQKFKLQERLILIEGMNEETWKALLNKLTHEMIV